MSLSSAHPASTETPAARPHNGYWSGVWRKLRRDPVALICGLILLGMLVVIVFAPLIAPHDPYQGSMIRRMKPVGTPGYLLGTDELGRDMLSRLIYGGRLSWFLGITPVAIACVIGSALGIVAGYFGGLTNMIIMRVTDTFFAFPSVLMAVAISGALGPGITNAMIAMTLVFIPQIIRIAESATTQISGLEYLDAARTSGASAALVIRRHVLPNVTGPILVYTTGLLGVALILASGLSFLGLGTRPPEPEWGLMLNTLRGAIYTQPMLAVLPGICICLTSLCFNMLSDGLRNAMDVKA